MKASYRASRSLLPTLGLLVLLGVLAVLQFQWTGQLSRAEGVRLHANLSRNVASFAREFDREITLALAVFAFGPPRASDDLALRYAAWTARATFPEIVRDVLIVEDDAAAGGTPAPAVSRFDPATRTIERIAPDAVRPLLERVAAGRHEHGRRRRTRPPVILEEPLALVVRRSPRGEPRFESRPHVHRLVVVRLDRAAIVERMLPELAERYFATDGRAAYAVDVRDAGGRLFSAGPAPPDDRWDVASSIFGILPFREMRDLLHGDDDPAPPDATLSPPPAARDDRGGIWAVRVTHPAGSLANAVARHRVRNLAISFAILVLLGVSVGFALRSARRAQELARQKMEFVAGVSHELRTPLAVICSAGQNLADGVAEDGAHARRYGDVIRREGRRLAEMVEQVLDLARVQSERRGDDAGPVDLHAVVDGALADCRALMEDEGVAVETRVPDELPAVQGEARALRQVLRNLITNAVRHTDGRWLRIEAGAGGHPPGSRVTIAVEDRGPGIPPADRERLFEPFYRGRATSRVHGSGLGLSLVRQIIDAHRGTVTIEERPGGGSRFVVELPAARSAARAAAAGRRGAPEAEPSGRA